MNCRVEPTDKVDVRSPAEQIVRLCRELTAEMDLTVNTDIVGIGIGVPGAVIGGTHVWAPNLSWDNFPLRAKIEDAFAVNVVLDSDRNTAILGEAWKGAARGVQNAVFLHVGTGIGAGILINSRLCRGHSEVAGSVGWLVTQREPLRSHGNIGWLEARAAGPSIAQRAITRIREGRCKTILKLANQCPTAVTSDLVAQAALEGDEEARTILRDIGEEIGIGIANVVTVLNPELIILGGGVAKAWPLLKDPLVQAVREWAQPTAAQTVRIVPSQLGEDAGLLGAARLALPLHGDLNPE